MEIKKSPFAVVEESQEHSKTSDRYTDKVTDENERKSTAEFGESMSNFDGTNNPFDARYSAIKEEGRNMIDLQTENKAVGAARHTVSGNHKDPYEEECQYDDNSSPNAIFKNQPA